MTPLDISNTAFVAALTATKDYTDKLGDSADQFGACGFAWVTITPKFKGNTKDGKAERAVLREMGFELNWTGKEFQKWNPSDYPGQRVDVKEIGAVAYAKVLKLYGFDAWAESRLD